MKPGKPDKSNRIEIARKIRIILYVGSIGY
jgi:hypothetical protein